MPQRDQLLSELQGDQHYGILLAAQMGGVPEEIQLLFETAVYDERANGLRPRGNYIVRALGVREHRVSLGLFNQLGWHDDHPLLYHHNTAPVALHFEGSPADAGALTLDISQAYATTFGPWRHLTDYHSGLNRSQLLVDLLASGEGLLGVMPLPLAERIAKVLAHHGMTAHLAQDPDYATHDEHGRSRLARLLLIDDGYVIALDFSVEQMGAASTPQM